MILLWVRKIRILKRNNLYLKDIQARKKLQLLQAMSIVMTHSMLQISGIKLMPPMLLIRQTKWEIGPMFMIRQTNGIVPTNMIFMIDIQILEL